ncbi:alpha/beta hydrolase [Streptomyces sp. Ru62]|uniref:alpha/beta hydrolase n=1 Tax=Streptomyces sp. Ru62 TaxID=2080745 RepID=UPI000CDD3EEB|nr:alpha/beta fold hydrolase [Streptomyces sp. Ru62]POX58693.1 alpha/beta hydrolase [Streptomyces sp. Ru62]
MKVENTTVKGVFIEYARSESSPSAAPIVFVHGGGQGSWVWENYLPFFAATGRDCYAFSWYNHHRSHELPEEQFAARSMAETVEELEIVVDHIGQVPVLVTHSMGALVGQKYAEQHPVVAQVHITPAICAEVGLHPERQLDLSKPVGIGSFEEEWPRVLAGCSEEDARRYYALLSRESALAIQETISTSFSVDRTRIGGPSLVIAAENDVVVPAEAIRRSAAYFGSDYLFLPGRTHNVLLEPGWRETAERIKTWLERQTW